MDSSTQPHRILIADDNEANRELLEAYLTGLDCVTATAEDGQETMEKAVAFAPDLILLDVMMPKLSGFEVCERIKSDDQLKKIMILMVTALNELGDIERAVDAGTNDFLTKPVNRIELVKRVENMLALKGMTDENEQRAREVLARDAFRLLWLALCGYARGFLEPLHVRVRLPQLLLPLLRLRVHLSPHVDVLSHLHPEQLELPPLVVVE